LVQALNFLFNSLVFDTGDNPERTTTLGAGFYVDMRIRE